jgi:glutamate formiminotransferase/formiminotetrahydrofolate cyclodeaminase
MCLEGMTLALRMAEIGNLNAISDAASGVYQANAGLEAAVLNVKINLMGYEEESRSKELLSRASKLKEDAGKVLDQLKSTLSERARL